MSEQVKGIDKLLTTQEAAELFGLKADTLNQWRYREKGPAYVKLCGKIMYEKKALLAFIKRQTVTPEAA